MLRSMYSAISGMDSFQTQLDVIGNNIANVDTAGYKSSRVNFSDVLSQTMSGASAPSPATGGTPSTGKALGGTNPMQVGLGTQISGIQTLFTQGADQSTGNPLDVAINGEGMFIVNDGGQTMYTREGDFSVDSNNNLVLPSGAIVQGFDSSGTGSNGTTGALQDLNLSTLASAPSSPLTKAGVSMASAPNVQIGSNGAVSVTGTDGKQYTIGYVAMTTFSNYAGLEKAGNSLYQSSSNSGTAASPSTPGTSNVGKLQSGYLEMSNVDLTREFSDMIVAQQGFTANTKMIATDQQILNSIVGLVQGG